MNTKYLGALLVAASLITTASAQEWHAFPPGNTIIGSEYVGANASSTVPFLLKTIPTSLSIDFSTANRLRMRLNGNPAPATINGYGGITRNGYVGISARANFFNSAFAPGPFTRLHLVDDEGSNNPLTYAQQFGFRPWMRNGVTFTGNSDQSYIGQQYMSPDATDMVIQWSDNPSTDPWGSDRMRFVFSASRDATATTGMGCSPSGSSFFTRP